MYFGLGEEKPASPWTPILGVVFIGAALYMAFTDPVLDPRSPYKRNKSRRRAR